jgi:predicted ArsR family transcriptional regulator
MTTKKTPLRLHSPKMTQAEARCFDAIGRLTEKLGRPPSILEVAGYLKITKSGAQAHMDALRLKGALEGPVVVGEWKRTPLGKKMRQALD